MALEEEFDIEIPDEEAEKITTVQAALDFISAQQASRVRCGHRADTSLDEHQAREHRP